MKRAEIKNIVRDVEAYCQTNGIRFTEPRRHVLEIIAGSDRPLGAYDILGHLAKRIDDPKPPTAYRAIEFLTDHGFIHRIESLNAYVMCGTDHRHEGSQFLICDGCGTVIEAHLCHLPKVLSDMAQAESFQAGRWNIEIHGLCQKCH